MTLFNMSFYGAVIILVILLIRAFTLHKLPKKTFLILWAVALLRLLVPFEIASDLSLYSHLPEAKPFENQYDYMEHKQPVSLGRDDTVISGENGGPVYLPTSPSDGEIVLLPDVDEDALPAIGSTNPEHTELWNHLRPHLPLFWGIGALLCACFFLISYLRCRLEFSTSLPVIEDYASDWLKQHPLKRTVSIRQSDKISAPLTYGIFRPVILMPKKTDWNNRTQLDYVLYHEFTHIRRFDLLAKLVTITAVCIHWFNPFVWLLYFFFNRDLELSCDDCVVKHFNEEKSAYANTLIGMEEKKNFSTPLCNHFSKNAIEERITAIMRSKKTTIGMMVAAIVIVTLVVVTLTTGRKETAKTQENSNADSSVMMEYKEVLTPRIQEYLTMMNSCFLNNPPIAGKATPENAISIAGNTGFYPVDEEVFPSYDALIGYVKDICTEKHADELCRHYWLLDLNVLPNIGVLSGKAYTKLFQSTTYPEHFEITDIKENIKRYYDTTLSATFRFTEGTNPYYWGVLTFAKQEDTWYVADVTLHRHPIDVSPTPTMSPENRRDDFPPTQVAESESEITPVPQETAEQLSDLFHSYRTMHMELFHAGPECGLHGYQAAESVTINGIDYYYKVLDERFPTMQSVIDYMETICTPTLADALRKEHLHMDSDLPFLAEQNGALFSQAYSSSTRGYSTDFQITSLQYIGITTVTAAYQSSGPSPGTTEVGTITFEVTEDGWRIASLVYDYQNIVSPTVN